MKLLAVVTTVVVGIGIAAVGVCAWMFRSAVVTTTRTDAYPTLLKDWSDTGLVDDFPRKIPSSAANVSLAANPGLGQGVGFLQLRMKLPADEVEAIMARAKAGAVRTCPGQCPKNIEDPAFWTVPQLEADANDGRPFPPDFVIYALKTNGDWNHPAGEGVAVSTARSEVVYWAQE